VAEVREALTQDPALREAVRFVDVRVPESFAAVRGVGFANVPLPDLATNATLTRAARDGRVYVMDQFGYHSVRAAQALETLGFRDVRVVDGGLFQWAVSGGALTSDNPAEAQRMRLPGAAAAGAGSDDPRPTLASLEAIASERGFVPDFNPVENMLLDVHYAEKEPDEREEARTSSPFHQKTKQQQGAASKK